MPKKSKKAKQATRNKGKKPVVSKADSIDPPTPTEAEAEAEAEEIVQETEEDAAASDPAPTSEVPPAKDINDNEGLLKKEDAVTLEPPPISEVTPAKDISDDETSAKSVTISILSPLASEFVPKVQFSEEKEEKSGEETDSGGGDGQKLPNGKSLAILEREKGEAEANPTESVKHEDKPARISTVLSTKHPLNSAWTLWYLNAFGKSGDWEAHLKEVYTVETIEDFWSLFNHVAWPTELRTGSDYSFFKKGIRPMWEDNKGGGRWLLNIDRRQSKDIDSLWQETILRLIGAEDGVEEVNGVVVNIRSKGNKMGLWLKQSQEVEEIRSVGRVFKSLLQLRDPIHFESHDSTQIKTGSTAKYLLRI